MEDTSEYDATMPVPDLDELQQEIDLQIPRVPVEIRDELLTHELPSRYVVQWTDLIGDTAYTPMVAGSYKHKRIQVISIDQDIFISATGLGGMYWPKGVVYTATHACPIQCKSAAAGQQTKVSVSVESWAD